MFILQLRVIRNIISCEGCSYVLTNSNNQGRQHYLQRRRLLSNCTCQVRLRPSLSISCDLFRPVFVQPNRCNITRPGVQLWRAGDWWRRTLRQSATTTFEMMSVRKMNLSCDEESHLNTAITSVQLATTLVSELARPVGVLSPEKI